ncbi:hypothetical protein AC578_9095 [Pseudocercospora eumusae]|uniref:Cytochrome P450 n=1 Tax=Pseudocercospora eumusae TaxID=321146 RepID=A0A139HVD2_9PEZI|nr:hypothetical protein AC578_9095 [Pseudocercospora eumusae]
MLTPLLFGIVALYVGSWVYRAARARQADTAFAAQRCCQDPPTLDTGRWPFGLELITKAFRAASEQRLLRLMLDIVENTGPTFEQKLLGSRGIDTVDPVNIEALLSKQFTDFGLGERRLVFWPLLGDGIFTQDGKFWEKSRGLLRPAFQNRDQSMIQIREAADNVVNAITSGCMIDLQPLFFRFTLETTSYLLFGQRIEAVNAEEAGDVDSFAAAFDSGQDYLAKRGRLGGLYWLIDGFDFRRQCKIVHGHLDKAIAKALHDQPSVDHKSSYSILQALVQQTRDPKVLREQCLNVLLAGRDTTACLLSWTFRLLARHPLVFERCRREVDEIGASVSEITRTELRRMRYLDAVLKEGMIERHFLKIIRIANLVHAVLRLYPSVPINSRMAVRTTTLPTGGGVDGKSPVLVRKGEAVGYCPYAMHRRKEIYGPDAGEFRPERWLERNAELVSMVGYGYLPFNAGPRICLGQDFALVEASCLIVRILQRFTKLSLAADEPMEAIGDEKQKLTLVLCSADGCTVVLS